MPKLFLGGFYVDVGFFTAIHFLFTMIFNFNLNTLNFYCGNYSSILDIILFKDFLNYIGTSNLWLFSDFCNLVDFRFFYLLNDTLENLENKFNILLLGSNLRLDSPLLNARLRKSFLRNSSLKVYSIGLALNYLTFPVKNIAILLIGLYLS